MDQTALSVTELTLRIKQSLEYGFSNVLLRGEISNLALPRSGHAYFNIKDEKSQIAGVMFRSALYQNRFDLENGMEVLFHGRISVYEPRGTYQLIVSKIEPVGAGALQLAYEQLKARLEAEGLFDPQYKKQLPFIPKGIGVVTSPTGAAIRDILNILERRFPGVPVLINPVLVQGEGSAQDIANAIQQFQNFEDQIDLMIVGRGGGSIEDLWSFNEEIVARAIFQSKIPVISAVGHETDFTIADFVSDLRAPTPSAAAELAVPLVSDLLYGIEDRQQRMISFMRQKLQQNKERLFFYQKRIRSPEWVIQGQMLKVDELTNRLIRSVQEQQNTLKRKLERLENTILLHSPKGKIEEYRNRLQRLATQLENDVQKTVEQKKQRLLQLTHVLDTMSPLSVLQRGYSTVTDKKKNLISSIDQVKEGSEISIRVTDGIIKSTVKETVSQGG